jgi:uncharacterized repeat protein (TIGR02543 family)
METSAYRLLKNIFRTGLFENPYLDSDATTTTVGQSSFMEAGYEAQLKSMVLAKNAGDLLPLDPAATKVYAPGQSTAQVALLETYFGAGNVITDASLAGDADVSLVFIASASAGGGSRDATAHVNNYSPINLDFKSYTAINARAVSVAGEPIRDDQGNVIGMENRSVKGKTTAPSAAATAAMQTLATAKAAGKPVIVVFNVSNPSVLTEIEPSAAALLFTFGSQRSAVLDMLVGKTSHTGTAQAIRPTGLLPMQFPKDMNEVEIQNEDVPRDMIAYSDNAGNVYDFGYGLTWPVGGGVTQTIDASVNPGYQTYVTDNASAMTQPLNTGANANSPYSILRRTKVTFDYGYRQAANDSANRSLVLIVNQGETVGQPAVDRPGHSFDGWYTASGQAFDFNTPITGDITLTATWDNQAPRPNLAGLTALVALADGLVEANYTAQTWTVLATAVQTARNLLNATAISSQATVDAAASQLSQAIAGLVWLVDTPTPTPTPSGSSTPTPSGSSTPTPSGSSTPTTAPATPAEQLTAWLKTTTAAVGAEITYTTESWAAYQRALTAAQAVAAKATATASEADTALNNLLKAVAGLNTKPIAPPLSSKVTTKSVAVVGKPFKKSAKPTVTVTVKLSSGTAKGKLAVYVGKKKVKTVKVSKTKTAIKLPKKYTKAISVKVKYLPTAVANGTAKTSKAVKVKVKK